MTVAIVHLVRWLAWQMAIEPPVLDLRPARITVFAGAERQN